MRNSLNSDIKAWENEGGAARPRAEIPVISSGTVNQVEWARRIKERVNDEFDRVARSFRSVASGQSEGRRSETEAILAILEDKREEVMRREEAGYFIRDWQEISDQVRQMIILDNRYQAIRARPRQCSHPPAPARS